MVRRRHGLAYWAWGRVSEVTSDGHRPYLAAVEESLSADIDYAMLVTIYGQPASALGRYSPGECVGAEHHRVGGRPDPAHISTSYAERQNLSMRMDIRRFTRLTNASSKKAENHAHGVAIYIMHYNFVRIHQTLRCTPAMASCVTTKLWELGDMVKILEDRETQRARVAPEASGLLIMLSRGIVYPVTGQNYMAEAIASAKSSMRFNPVPHLVFCDTPPTKPNERLDFVLFVRSGNPFLDKVRNMARTPFGQTLFLDTDTYVTDNIDELFDLLSRFDVAAAHAPAYTKCDDRGQSEAFYDFNTGVIPYRNTVAVAEFLASWAQLYERWSQSPPFSLFGIEDQPPFRRALWKSSLSLLCADTRVQLSQHLPRPTRWENQDHPWAQQESRRAVGTR